MLSCWVRCNWTFPSVDIFSFPWPSNFSFLAAKDRVFMVMPLSASFDLWANVNFTSISLSFSFKLLLFFIKARHVLQIYAEEMETTNGRLSSSASMSAFPLTKFLSVCFFSTSRHKIHISVSLLAILYIDSYAWGWATGTHDRHFSISLQKYLDICKFRRAGTVA